MRIALLVMAAALGAAAEAGAQAPAPAPPGGTAPAGATPPAAVVPPTARAFTAPTGIIFNAVRPERVVDFELVIGYLQAALAQSANPQLRAQAEGWRMYKAIEPGPNNTVLYVFWFDPAVVGGDYALGPILSDAYPDQVEQIWKLYQGALAGAGSQTLLNLTPVMPPPLPPAGAPVPPPAGTPPAATTLPGAAPTSGPAARPTTP